MQDDFNVIWKMDNTDCLVPDDYIDYDSDYDGTSLTIQQKKNYIDIADAYRLFKNSNGVVQLQGLVRDEWGHSWHTGSLINHLVNQIKEYEHRLKIKCRNCGGNAHECWAFLGADMCCADPERANLHE